MSMRDKACDYCGSSRCFCWSHGGNPEQRKEELKSKLQVLEREAEENAMRRQYYIHPE